VVCYIYAQHSFICGAAVEVTRCCSVRWHHWILGHPLVAMLHSHARIPSGSSFCLC